VTSVVLDRIQDVLGSSCNLVLDDDLFPLSLNVSYSLISLNSLSVASAQRVFPFVLSSSSACSWFRGTRYPYVYRFGSERMKLGLVGESE
jgi:hypothetical protein